MDESLVKFTRQEIDIGRVESLARLVAACQKNGVELQQVFLYQNGFQVLLMQFCTTDRTDVISSTGRLSGIPGTEKTFLCTNQKNSPAFSAS